MKPLARPLKPVAQYLRMSTEHQRYSLEFQSAANAAYAQARGYGIVATYVDSGISGLSLKGRDGLKRLLSEIMAGQDAFEAVLVYDVSRWGRFQDPDQSAHYEFVCREAGIAVEYCAEPFVNDGGMAGALVKQLKRAMAAEYSRELSLRIARSKRGLAEKGYWVTGRPPYGLARMLVAADGQPGPRLEPGQHKLIQAGRCVLVAGPEADVRVVRDVFRWFVDGESIRDIARRLNAAPRPGADPRRWIPGQIHLLLRNETYAGVLVTGKSERHLGDVKWTRRADWRRKPGGCEALIPQALFDAAQARFGRRPRPGVSNDILLSELRSLLRREGRLSRSLIERDRQTCSAELYVHRFGSLSQAYALVGYQPTPRQIWAAEHVRKVRPSDYVRRYKMLGDDQLLERLRAVFAIHGRLNVGLIDAEPDIQSKDFIARFGGLRRAYALVGYEPSENQDRIMDARGAQSITRAEARRLREQVLAAGGPLTIPS